MTGLREKSLFLGNASKSLRAEPRWAALGHVPVPGPVTEAGEVGALIGQPCSQGWG